MGINPCDDGNNINGDGCSATCQIERGWNCSGGSKITKDVCKDVVPHKMHIIRNKNNTLVTVLFSEKSSIMVPQVTLHRNL